MVQTAVISQRKIALSSALIVHEKVLAIKSYFLVLDFKESLNDQKI
jgi:hypothetical protein